MKQPKPATEITARMNALWYDELPFEDEREKDCALRGLIEAADDLVIRNDEEKDVWSVKDYAFLKEADAAPKSVNPSLWRNTLYNSYAGLFEVCDGIYQVRGYDMANATFIRTDSGWLVFDVMMCTENMKAAKALMEKHFGPISVRAVLYSHSHIDHYGGILGLIDREDAADAALPLSEQLASGKTVVLAPAGFLKYAVSENVYAGIAMGRRAQYQYGTLLMPGRYGRMGIGIGLGQTVGSTGLIAPTYEIRSNETLIIDGLEIRFQLTPGTEAPVEMHAYFPKYRGLWLAENCTGTMHNLYTLRGAQVRDAAAWAHYILEAEQLFGKETDVVFQSHNWPHWGRESIQEYMENTAAVYQFIHDQTLRLINFGYTAAEISNSLRLPERLNRVWYTRQYYGTLSHNIKAVYQKYMGWYDANPVNLNPLSPEETAKKWAEYLGDVDAVLEKARRDYEAGEYQWVAQITKELVFADPTNQAARELCADALEQLGYQAESGPWRNAYLTGALELREGNQAARARNPVGGIDNRLAMTAEMMLDFIRIRSDSLAAQDDDLSMNFIVEDEGERLFLKRRAGVTLIYKDLTDPDAACTVTCSKQQLLGLMLRRQEALASLKIEGDATAVMRLLRYMSPITQTFNIIEP
ncbi:MAG: MBL fold metallo-hydrolase [Oscillospiraceae bacterium]|nr:MBL fold metallo-hydrolase [Oscillospiraceae bacterium]